MSGQKPSLGRIVIAIVDPDDGNNGGQDEAAAMITRVHSDTLVDLTVFPAGDAALRKVRDVQLYGSRTAAEKGLREHLGDLPVRKDEHNRVVELSPAHVTPWVPAAYWPTVTAAAKSAAAQGTGDKPPAS